MCVVPRQEPCPGNTGAKLQNVWESAKKVEEKFGGDGKNAYLCHKKETPSYQQEHEGEFFGSVDFSGACLCQV